MIEEPQDKNTIHILKLVIVAILCFVVIVFVFGVGIFVGQERAQFSFRWAENYHRNFGGPSQGVFGNFPDQDFTNSHGIFGSIIKIDGNSLIIKGQDNIEKTAVISNGTTIINQSGEMQPSWLKVNDRVVIIGSPNDQGQVDAKFIRVLPAAIFPSIYIYHLNTTTLWQIN